MNPDKPVVIPGSEVPEVEQERQPPSGDPLGYIVLIDEHGYWAHDWDGEVHETREQGDVALTAATAGGWTAALVAAIRVDQEPSGGAAALRADVVALVLEEVEALRRDIPYFREIVQHTTHPTYIGQLDAADAETRIFDRLDRIEAAVREGEQR